MDLRSILEVLTETKTSRSKAQAMTIGLRRLPWYFICAGLGLVGGATGVALAVGLAILTQLLLPPPTVFSPGAISLIATATLAGLGASWLLSWVAHRILPSLLRDSEELGLQVTLVVGVFVSLLQTLLFTRGL
jgi:hypothetical protein